MVGLGHVRHAVDARGLAAAVLRGSGHVSVLSAAYLHLLRRRRLVGGAASISTTLAAMRSPPVEMEVAP
jgi:hypothetical protein